ncbi:MAG: heat shock protein Hsp20, family protein [Patescibacteria group bacterium]|nr:heat shock protein Hsp20, family protein [Patescibacteria group bacterium]
MMHMALQKKRSFFERLTGSIRMQDDDEQVVIAPKKPVSPYAEYDEEFEDDTSTATTVKVTAMATEDEDEEAQLAVDVYETHDAIVIKTMTAGVKKEDLEITVSRETITIRGRRENEARSYQHEYHIQELYWGAFSRTIDLPDEIDIEQASATEHHGLVTIKLPKFDKKRHATLKVQ